MMQKSSLALSEAPEDCHEDSPSGPGPLSVGGPIVFVTFKLCVLIALCLSSSQYSIMVTFLLIPMSRQSYAGSSEVFGPRWSVYLCVGGGEGGLKPMTPRIYQQI